MVLAKTKRQEQSYGPIQIPVIDDDTVGASFVIRSKEIGFAPGYCTTEKIVEGLTKPNGRRYYFIGNMPEKCDVQIRRVHGEDGLLITELKTENPDDIQTTIEYLEANRMRMLLGDVQVFPISKYPDRRVRIGEVPSSKPFDVTAAYVGLLAGKLPPWKQIYFSEKGSDCWERYHASETVGNLTYECIVNPWGDDASQTAGVDGKITIKDGKDFVTVNQREQVSMSDGIDATKENLLVELIKAAAKAK